MATGTKFQLWWEGGALVVKESDTGEVKKYLGFSISFPHDTTLQPSIPQQLSSKQIITSPPTARVVPSMDHIKQHLNVLPNTSLFYSRIGKGAPSYKLVAKKWRDSYNPSLYVLEESWDTTQTWTQFYGYNGAASLLEKDIFWARACRALAELASGRVYVVLGPGITAPDWGDSDTAWAKEEWPALQANQAVTEVIQIDPVSGSMKIILSH